MPFCRLLSPALTYPLQSAGCGRKERHRRNANALCLHESKGSSETHFLCMANYLMVANYHFHPVLNQRDTRGLRCTVGHFSARGALHSLAVCPKAWAFCQPKKRGRALLTQFHPCLVLRTGCAFPSPRSPEAEKGRLLLHEGARALCTLDGAGWHPGVPGEGVSPLCSLTLLTGRHRRSHTHKFPQLSIEGHGS